MLLAIGIIIVISVALWGWRKIVPPTIEQRLDYGNRLLAEGGDCAANFADGTDDEGCQKTLQSAAVEYRSVIRMQPKNAEAYMGLGEVYLNLDGKGDKKHSYLVKAIVNWRKAVQLEPASAYAHFQMSLTLHYLGQNAASAKEERIAHRLLPHDNSDFTYLPPGARKFENDD